MAVVVDHPQFCSITLLLLWHRADREALSLRRSLAIYRFRKALLCASSPGVEVEKETTPARPQVAGVALDIKAEAGGLPCWHGHSQQRKHLPCQAKAAVRRLELEDSSLGL